jgi:N-acyl-L-homoserine lactone synthetase
VEAAAKRSFASDGQAGEGRLAESVARLLARSDYRRADSEADKEAIYRLRYDAYVREGAISENSTRTFSDSFDNSDNAYLFGLYIDGELASSVRLHVADESTSDLPSLEVFPDYLQPKLDAGIVLVDSTRFVADEKFSREHRGLPYATLRICMLAAEYFGADEMPAPVRAEHQAFYRRAFEHRLVCEPRPYPQLAKPICLMTIHFPSAASRLYSRYPFFRSTLAERQTLFERTGQQNPRSARQHRRLGQG